MVQSRRSDFNSKNIHTNNPLIKPIFKVFSFFSLLSWSSRDWYFPDWETSCFFYSSRILTTRFTDLNLWSIELYGSHFGVFINLNGRLRELSTVSTTWNRFSCKFFNFQIDRFSKPDIWQDSLRSPPRDSFIISSLQTIQLQIHISTCQNQWETFVSRRHTRFGNLLSDYCFFFGLNCLTFWIQTMEWLCSRQESLNEHTCLIINF